MPGDGCRLPADQAGVLDDLAILVEIHVAVRRQRRLLAIIEKGDLVVLVNQHEATTADIACVDIGDGHCKAGGDGSVNRVAATQQDLFGDVRSVRIGNGNCRLPGDRCRLRALAAGSVCWPQAASSRPSRNICAAVRLVCSRVENIIGSLLVDDPRLTAIARVGGRSHGLAVVVDNLHVTEVPW